MKNIEVMDTTLRDGEQTSGMSFSASEKLTITKLLINELNIDRIEVASARVSSGEFDAVKSIMKWSKKNNLIERVEVLTFIDNGISIDWLALIRTDWICLEFALSLAHEEYVI